MFSNSSQQTSYDPSQIGLMNSSMAPQYNPFSKSKNLFKLEPAQVTDAVMNRHSDLTANSSTTNSSSSTGLLSSSQVFNTNPFKPPVYQQQKSAKMFQPNSLTSSQCSEVPNLLIMSSSSSSSTNVDTSSRREAKTSRVSSNSFLKGPNGTFSSMIESKENNSLAGNTSAMTVEEFLNDNALRGSSGSNPNNAKLSSRNSLFSQTELSNVSNSSSDQQMQIQQLIKANSHQPVTSSIPLLRNSSQLARQNSSNSQSRSISSSGFMGDRFIPFRGNQDQYIQEFILNNEDPFSKDARKQAAKPASEEDSDVEMRVNQTPNGLVSQEATSVAPQRQSTVNNDIAITRTADRVQNSAIGSSGGSSTQYSLGSGHKKKQSFQELITESMFTKKRGSPNTLTLQEAEEEELRFSRLPEGKRRGAQMQENCQNNRILSFKEKRDRPSMSLHKNISLIQTLAQEKTQKQQKNLRSIPQFPEKILDAPDIVDDYYLNLLDWSSGNILAVCLAQTVYLWNAETGDIKQVFDTENDADIVTSVAWMKGQNNVLAIGTSSKQLHLWDTNQFTKIKTFENQHSGRVSCLAWNPAHGHLLSSGSFDSHIHNNDIRAPSSQSIVTTFFGHRQEVCGLKWSPDGQQLASGGNDNLLCIWDINSRMRGGIFQQNFAQPNVITSPKYCFTDHKAAVKALAWCPWQRHLLASGGGSRDQTIKFWNTDAGCLVQSIQTESQVCSLQWNPYDREILSSHGFVNNQLCIWKYPQMKKIADLRGHTSRVLHLALSPDGTTVASAAADETLRFWKVFQPSQSGSGKRVKHQLPLAPRCSAPTREADNAAEHTISSVGNLGVHQGSPSDIIMSDYTQFFQASPSQFNGYSLR